MENKHPMTVEDNIFFAKRNIVDLIFKSARLEGLSVTYPDTYSVVNAGIINGMTLEDATVLNNLKRAWQFVLETIDCPMNLRYVCQIHKYVGESLAGYNAGFLRSQVVHVTMGGEEPFTPGLLIEADVRDEIGRLMQIENETERAISLMLHFARRQMFNDGNKRVAMLAANKVMIGAGAGIISVPPSKLADFVRCLTDYYRSGDMEETTAFVYEHCISGNGVEPRIEEPGMESF
ncbi:MAG: Fic family protein [Clostridiales Family XIII bacterium]|jgi:Fic family protein|nr:Fic family protein [Clostridiales Family XIII bacterium]